jgi:hypothetical protein
LVQFPVHLDVHLEMNEICKNFRYACEIPTRTFGVYEGECRTCLYWPPDEQLEILIDLVVVQIHCMVCILHH